MNDKHETKNEEHKTEKQVTIFLDGKPRKIEAGTYTQAEFKDKLGIDPSKIIEIFVHGKFEPIPDGKSIEVKEGEKFATHVPRGGSSWR
jgi:hypothetical protein